MSEHDMHLLDSAPFGRILPAMVTPMQSDGSVDFAAAQKLAKYLVADGADGLVVNGTTGESPVTHMDEKVELVRAVKEVEKMSMNTKKNVSIGLLALAMLLWALRKLNVLYVPGLSMILLAVSMLLVGSIMFQLKEKKKVGGTLIFAFGLFCIVAAVVEIRNFVA